MTNKKQNLNPAPKLKKKNGIWRIVLVPAISFLLGGVAVVGLVNGVPAVNNALIRHDTTLDNTPGTDLPTQDDSGSQEQISNLQQSLDKLSTELTQTKNQLNTSNSLVVNKELEVQQLKTETDNLTTELEQAKENAVLYEQTQQQLAETTSALETAQLELEQARIDNNLSAEEIAVLEQNVTNLTNEKTSLESTISNLNAEIEYYKELLGDDINYANLVVELQTSLDEKTSALETTSAELETLTAEHNELLTLVAELQTELEQVREELSNYVASSTLDKLQIENYDGTWYLNGTFEDYLIIENGIVTRGLNVDSGALQVMYNEMFMLLNNGGGQKITLADNGTKITLADGSEYTKFTINKKESCEINMSVVCGTYVNNTKQFVLYSDNTLVYSENDSIYYGSFVVTAEKHNIAGNVTITHYITATVNFEDNQKTYNFTTTGVELVDINNNVAYSPLKKDFTYVAVNNNIKTNCYKLTLMFNKPLKTSEISSFKYYLPFYTTSTYAYNSYVYVNGVQTSTSYENSKYTNYVQLSGGSFDSTYVQFLTLYIYSTQYDGYAHTGTSYQGTSIYVYDSAGHYSIVKCSVVDYEKLGTPSKSISFPSSVTSCVTDPTIFYKDCNTISEYYVGSYLNEETVISLAEDGTATIGELTGTYTATAKTDGTNIVHTLTLTYDETQIAEDETEVTVTHTLTFDLTNNTFAPANATLDGTEITLTHVVG